MNLKPSYVVIPLIVFLFAAVGTAFTTADSVWYATLAKPAFAPPGSLIGAVWTTIFVLTAISVILWWNKRPRDERFNLTLAAFVLNGVLNAAWSYIFFTAHLLGLAVLDSALLGASVLWLVASLWKRHRASAYLLVPYLAWVSFATFLAFAIWRANT
jgi:translocator protein